MQSCVATDSENLLRPRVGEGRNNVLKRGRYAAPVSESVHERFGFGYIKLSARESSNGIMSLVDKKMGA